MSRLEFYQRPLVAFDAANKEHRRWYAEFQKSTTWGHCPVRFICPEDSSMDLPGVIMRQLLDYYVTREFVKEWTAENKGPAATCGTHATRTHKG